MTRLIATATLLFMLHSYLPNAIASEQPISMLDDIEFWVGSGANRSALAIDWDGQSATDTANVWGFRWDNSAVASDALLAVLPVDKRLYAKLGTDANEGTAIIGLGYDDNDDGQFALTDGTVFDEAGINASNLSDGVTSVDPADRYSEGWFLGFWHLGFAAEIPTNIDAWTSSQFGIDQLVLEDEQWLSLTFTDDPFSTNEFAENLVAAAPSNAADFDADNDIDGADYLVWQRGFESTFAAADLQAWSQSYASAGATAILGTVPEPTTTLIFASGVFNALGTRGCRRRRITRRSIE